MPTLDDPPTLLSAWESAAAVPAVARGAVLVDVAGLTDDLDTALDLPIGACAELAIRGQVEAFGGTVDAVLVCPDCGEHIEVELALQEFIDGGSRSSQEDPNRQVGAFMVRAATTRDLVAVMGEPDPRTALFARCVTRSDGSRVRLIDLDQADAEAIETTADELAGVAATMLHVACPGCGASVRSGLDPCNLLWQQTQRSAAELLQDVAKLAAAFGWSEDEVLALTAARRRSYLEIVS